MLSVVWYVFGWLVNRLNASLALDPSILDIVRISPKLGLGAPLRFFPMAQAKTTENIGVTRLLMSFCSTCQTVSYCISKLSHELKQLTLKSF